MADTAITPTNAFLLLGNQTPRRSDAAWSFVGHAWSGPELFFGSNVSLSMPSGIKGGDVAILIVRAAAGSSFSTPPTGYTLRYSINTAGPTVYVWTRTLDGSETTTTLVSTANYVELNALVYRGAEESSIQVSMSLGTAAGATSPSGTAANSNSLTLFCFFGAVTSTGDGAVVPSGARSYRSGGLFYSHNTFPTHFASMFATDYESVAGITGTDSYSWQSNTGTSVRSLTITLASESISPTQSLAATSAPPTVSLGVGGATITTQSGSLVVPGMTAVRSLGSVLSAATGATATNASAASLVLGTLPAISTAQSQITGLQGLVGITIAPQSSGLSASGFSAANSFGTLRQPSAGTSLISGNLSPWGVGDQTSAGTLSMVGNAPLITGQLVPNTATIAASGISSRIDQASYPGAAALQGVGSYVGSMDTLLPTPSAILSVSVGAPIPNYDEFPGVATALLQALSPSVSYGTQITALTGAVTAQGTQVQQSYSSVIPVGSLVAVPVAASVTRQDMQVPATGNLFAVSGNSTIALGVQSQAGPALLGVSSPDVSSQTIRVPGVGAAVAAGTALVTDSGIQDGTGAISAQGQAAGIKLTSSILLVTGNSILVGSSPSAVVAPFLMSPATGSLTAAGNFPVRVYQPLGMSAVCAEAPVGRVSTSINH